MSEHAKLSPSAFGRWSKCPGSVRLSKGLPNVSSEAAQWGTDAHQILEDMVNFWLNPEETMPDYEFDDVVEKIEVAGVAMEYLTKRYTEADAAKLNPVIMSEQRVYLEWCTGNKDIWGSGDVIISTDEWIEIIDLKAGSGMVVEPTSGQLKIYGLGAADLHNGKPTEVICTIVQPRIPHDKGLVRSEYYTYEWLMDWNKEVLIPAIEATEGDELVPGASQCQFCLAKPTCTAVAHKAEKLAMSVFQDQTKKTFADLVSINPDEIPMEKIVEIIENAPLITGWLKAIEKYAVSKLAAREDIPGYKLVHAAGRNKWSKSDEDVLADLAKGKGCIKKAQLTKTVSLSAPQALKIKGLKPEQLDRVKSLIVKSEGSLTLVPETDKRADAFPAVQFNDMSFLN